MPSQVLLGVGSSIFVIDEDSAQEHPQLGSAAVTQMAVSPNGQFLAAFTSDGRLVVLLADLTRTLSEFSTQSDAQPDQMGWCGTDSVVLVWKVRLCACPAQGVSGRDGNFVEVCGQGVALCLSC